MIVRAAHVQPGDVIIGRADSPPFPAGPLTVRSVRDHRLNGVRVGPRLYWLQRVAPIDLRDAQRLVVRRA